MDFGYQPYQTNILGGFKAPTSTSKPTISQAPMQSYNVFADSKLPGVSPDKADKIIQYATTTAKSDEERKIMLQEMHQKAVELEQKQAYAKDRDNAKAQMVSDALNTKDDKERSQLQLTLKLANFSDLIRDMGKKNGLDLSNLKDEEVVSKYTANDEVAQQQFTDYLNNKKTGLDVGRELGLIQEQPKEMTMVDVEGKNPLLRAGAGLLKGGIGAVKGAYEGIISGFGQLIEDSKRIIADPNKSAPEKFNQILFGEIGADYLGGIIGDTFGGTLEGLYEGFTSESERKYISEKTKGVMESITKTEPVQNIMKKYNQLDQNEQQELNDLLGYAMNATNFLGLEAGLSKPVQGALKEGGEMLVKGLDTTAGKVLGKLDNVKIGKQATIEDANSIVGKIIQGETSDIAPALEALKNIDTKGVASYKDLSEILEARGKNYMELVDENLLKDTRKLKPKDTTVTTTVGNTTVTQTPIVKGITQLEELYSSIDDPTNLARIKELNTKFKNEGLSLKELNDVAREYNSVFKAKAFSKLGDPLTSVNAQAYENNRKAMKEFVRSQLPDDTTKLLDKQYSNIASTKQLVDKMVEKVNSLSQKINKRGTIENIARGIGRAVDVASFGGVRGLLTSFLPSNIGNKVLNSIDLEDALKSSLKKLDTIIKKIDNGTITESDIKFLTPKTPNGTSTTNSSNPSIQQSKVLNKTNDISVRKPTVMMKTPEPVIENLNPTGKIFTDYTPEQRLNAKLGKNITTLDKTSGMKPDDMITVYRGTKGTEINPGDFITTNKQLAKDYIGNGNVVEKKVRVGDILDDITEPLGEEYIYRPAKQPKPLQAKVSNPVVTMKDPLITEAKKYNKTIFDMAKKYKSVNGFEGELYRFDGLSDGSKYVRAMNTNNFPRLGGDEMITVYRGGVGNEIKPGDWIADNLEGAKRYGKVTELEIKKSDIVNPGIAKGELIYAPKNMQMSVKQIREEANKTKGLPMKKGLEAKVEKESIDNFLKQRQTTDKYKSDWITTDGRLASNQGPDHNATAMKYYGIDRIGMKDDYIRDILKEGPIRMHYTDGDVTLNIGNNITPEQIRTINDNFSAYGGYWKNDIFIDFENGESKVFRKTQYKPEDVIKYLEEHISKK